MRICTRCPPDDNEWDDEEFSQGGNAFKNVCNACYTEAYKNMNLRCQKCGGIVKTRRKPENRGNPVEHRKCPPKKKLAGPRTINPTRYCISCGKDTGKSAKKRGWRICTPCTVTAEPELFARLEVSERAIAYRNGRPRGSK